MTDEQGKALLLSTFVLTVALITWSEIKDYHRVPVPARYVSAGIMWGVLGVAAPFISYPLAGVFGIGMFVALLYKHWSINADNKAIPAEPIPNAPIPPPVSI